HSIILRIVVYAISSLQELYANFLLAMQITLFLLLVHVANKLYHLSIYINSAEYIVHYLKNYPAHLPMLPHDLFFSEPLHMLNFHNDKADSLILHFLD